MDGFALTPTYTNKRVDRANGTSEKKRYRYYVSQNAIRLGHRESPVTTLNAPILEETVQRMLAQALPEALPHLSHGEFTPDQLEFRLQAHAARIAVIDSPMRLAELIRFLSPKIVVSPEQVQIRLPVDSLMRLVDEPTDAPKGAIPDHPMPIDITVEDSVIVVSASVRISSRRGRGELVNGNTGEFVRPSQTNPDPSLIRALAQAEFWRLELQKNPTASLGEVLKPHGIKPGYVRRLLNAAYLAPEIKRAIFQGTQPTGLQVQDLLRPLPMDWQEQKRELGFGPNGATASR